MKLNIQLRICPLRRGAYVQEKIDFSLALLMFGEMEEISEEISVA
jgi:hypothetical protein